MTSAVTFHGPESVAGGLASAGRLALPAGAPAPGPTGCPAVASVLAASRLWCVRKSVDRVNGLDWIENFDGGRFTNRSGRARATCSCSGPGSWSTGAQCGRPSPGSG